MRNTEIIDVLSLAAAHLVDLGWTTDVLARDERGGSVYSDDPAADSFCLLGALMVASALPRNEAIPREVLSLLRQSLPEPPPPSIDRPAADLDLALWNNRQTDVQPVLDLFSRAAHTLSSK